MPNTRHQRHHRQRDEDAHNNNHHHAAAMPAEPAAGGGGMAHQARQNDNAGMQFQKCCSPTTCRFPDDVIDVEDPYDAVKVLCNNETCDEGNWMHKDCFEEFQQSVLAYLRSCGRARSWSEKQRLQNLWTKKGYDLAFKACDCKCGRGHLRKDLDYIPPPLSESKKHKRHKKKNDKPMPVVSTTHKSNSHSSNATHNAAHTNAHVTHGHVNGNLTAGSNANVSAIPTTQQQNSGHGNHNSRTTFGQGSKKSGNSATTPKKTTTLERSKSDDNAHILQTGEVDNQPRLSVSANLNNNHHYFLPSCGNPQMRLRTNSMSSTGSAGSHSSSISSVPSSAGSISPISSSPVSGDMFFKTRKISDASSSDNGHTSTGSLGFRQRADLSAFASLPRNKQNPYHIRMEDSTSLSSAFSSACSLGASKMPSSQWEPISEDGSCDVETRNFVLSNLLNKRMCSSRCVLCKTGLPVFDRFPLLDGTFFLSPQCYDEAAIQVIWEGRLQFLNAACLGCLEGRGHVKCLACKRPWDGRNLVIGSMYTYDIFAAAPCCQKRLTCKCCRRAVVDIQRGLDFFSQYSQMIICPYCKANDYHFIRSLPETFLLAEGEAAVCAPICH